MSDPPNTEAAHKLTILATCLVQANVMKQLNIAVTLRVYTLSFTMSEEMLKVYHSLTYTVQTCR